MSIDHPTRSTGAASRPRRAPSDPDARGERGSGEDREGWIGRFERVRAASLALVRDLTAEDQVVQSMPDASPAKWHLAHTTWFFETFLLIPWFEGYRPVAPAYAYLFNSYYDAVGDRHPRPQRGLLTRPSLAEVLAYRSHVEEAMRRLIADLDSARWAELAGVVELGLNHEQQHQELILMDIKHLFSCNPLRPAYRAETIAAGREAAPLAWIGIDGGLVEIGHDGEGFAFDNERPRHRVWLEPFRLGDRLTTAGEYLAFIADGGYDRPDLWLSDGWARAQAEGWRAPLYWRSTGDGWRLFTLAGETPLDRAAPVCHLSFYEADAFARWAGARLPTEAEWEHAIAQATADPAARGAVADDGRLHPAAAPRRAGLKQMIGDVWEWTASAYHAYPGYRPPAGALGEYNGKFMSGQMVLRGGACVTPVDHVRASYRNFFPPHARWAFSGLRLATDAS